MSASRWPHQPVRAGGAAVLGRGLTIVLLTLAVACGSSGDRSTTIELGSGGPGGYAGGADQLNANSGLPTGDIGLPDQGALPPGIPTTALPGGSATTIGPSPVPTSPFVTVPNVRGRRERDAIRALNEAGFRVTSRFEPGEFDEGDAIGTLPEAGRSIDRGSVVTLRVSTGRPAATTSTSTPRITVLPPTTSRPPVSTTTTMPL